MLYQGDAHHYRAIIRRKQRSQRIRGSLLIVLSISLMFYAVPCFATSVFDYDDASGIFFSNSVSDHESTEDADGEAADTVIMSETVGPAMLSDDSAVDSAKKRAEAMHVVTSTQNTMVSAKAVTTETTEEPAQDVFPAIIAAVLSFVCAVLGIRMITRSRQILGRRIAAEYGSALRAC